MTVQHSRPGRLGPIFETCAADGRAALIGYLPTGYPDVPAFSAVLVPQLETVQQHYAVLFEDMPELTADDLDALGVTSVGHRRKLLAALAGLRAGSAPSTARPIPAPPARWRWRR